MYAVRFNLNLSGIELQLKIKKKVRLRSNTIGTLKGTSIFYKTSLFNLEAYIAMINDVACITMKTVKRCTNSYLEISYF